MDLPPPRVHTHDSARARQTPIAVTYEGERLEIAEILDAWISTGVDTAAPVIHGFVVRCRGGARFKLEHHSVDGWRVEPVPGPRLV